MLPLRTGALRTLTPEVRKAVLETIVNDDAPDSERTGVCVRILPTTYAQFQQIQRRMGLRRIAGAWEFLLKLGFAAAERLPAL